MLDKLPMERVVELYATAVWVGEEEEKLIRSKTRRR
jgi:hypothetical protein